MSKSNTFRFDKHKRGETLQIFVYGEIGMDFFGEGVSALNIVKLLSENPDVAGIEVHINSGGGNLFDGVAIHTALVHHPAPVTTFVEGVAASAASLIAMAGDVRNIAQGSIIMVHNAAGTQRGDAREMQKKADLLLLLNTEMASIYAARTGLETSTVLEMMDAETWLRAGDAVDQGFATHVIEAEIAASVDLAAFDYKHAPTLHAAGGKFVSYGVPTPSLPTPKLSAPTIEPAHNGDLEMSKILAQAAGLTETATDAEIVAEMSNLRANAGCVAELEKQIADFKASALAIAEVVGETGDKAVGMVAAWKSSHATLAQNTTDLEAIKAQAEKDKMAGLIKAAKDGGKLTADLETFALTCNLQTLEGFLASLGKVVPIDVVHVPKEGKVDASKNATGYSFDGVDYADMDGLQKAAFAVSNPVEWQAALAILMDRYSPLTA